MFASTMVTAEERAALIALVRRGDRPWHHYSELAEAAGSALAVLHGDIADVADEYVQTLFPIEAEIVPPNLDAIQRELREWSAEGIEVITVLDDEYPVNLRTIHNRPPFLFVHGELRIDDARSVAVVGTRKPAPQGLEQARAVAKVLGESGYIVVSGLAEGIDAAAHSSALESGHRTVAVIGTGLRKSYPKSNQSLQVRIAQHGAVVSQFWPDAPPARHHFPMRNVVMSGLALATLVIEAGDTSGARMQARFALEHGRPVFLMRSLLVHDWARRYADKPGVHVVDSPTEVAAHLDRLISLSIVPN